MRKHSVLTLGIVLLIASLATPALAEKPVKTVC